MAAPPLHHLTVQDVGDVTVTALRDERITEELNIQAVGDELYRVVDELGKRRVLLDFAAVKFMSSTMIGKLPGLQNRLVGVQGKLVLCGLSDNLLHAIKLLTLDRKLNIVPDQQAGLNAF